MPVQHEFFVAQRCDFLFFCKENNFRNNADSITSVIYSNLHLSPMNINLEEYFRNSKNGKTLISFLQLTDNIKICSLVYHQISFITTDSIWGMPVHTDMNCSSWAGQRKSSAT